MRKILGIVALEYKTDEMGELRRMSVDKRVRRQKIASKLIQHLLGFAKQEGYKKVFLSTLDLQVAACILYEKLGFVKTIVEPFEEGDEKFEEWTYEFVF